MTYGCFANVLRLDTQMRTRAGTEVVQQAFDGRDSTERIVSEADGEGFGRNRAKGQGSEASGAGEFFVAGTEGAPVLDHPRRGIFEPAQALAGEVAAHAGQQRHDPVPFDEHLPALCGCVVTPVGILRADCDQMANRRPGSRQARRTTAKAMAHHVDRLAGVLALCALEHCFCVQRAPVRPRGRKTAQRSAA